MNTPITRVCRTLAGTLVIVLLLATAFAQEEPARASEQVKMKKTLRVKAVETTENDTDVLRAQIERCGAACLIGGSGTIAAPGGGTLDYDCDDNGNCACFGASDCVKMSDVCEEGTIGCNDQGCICKQGSGGDGG
jgi:hypothetical protein